MSWTIEFIEAQNYVRINIEGNFNVDDYLRMIVDLISQKYWKNGMNALADNRAVNFKGAGFDDMQKAREIRIRFDKQLGSGKFAILMAGGLNFGKGRQYEIITENKVSGHIRAFLDEDKAISWLTGDLE